MVVQSRLQYANTFSPGAKPLSQVSPMGVLELGERADDARFKLDKLTAAGNVVAAKALWDKLPEAVREWIEGEDEDGRAYGGDDDEDWDPYDAASDAEFQQEMIRQETPPAARAMAEQSRAELKAEAAARKAEKALLKKQRDVAQPPGSAPTTTERVTGRLPDPDQYDPKKNGKAKGT